MKKNKPTKPTKTNQSYNPDREFAVVLERLETEFKTFGEDLKGIRSKVDIMWDEMGRQREDINIIKADIRIMKEDIKVLKADVSEMKVTLKSHDNRLGRLESVMC